MLDTWEFSKNLLWQEDLSIYPTVRATTSISEKINPPPLPGWLCEPQRVTPTPSHLTEVSPKQWVLLSRRVMFCLDPGQLLCASNFISVETQNASTLDPGGTEGGQCPISARVATQASRKKNGACHQTDLNLNTSPAALQLRGLETLQTTPKLTLLFFIMGGQHRSWQLCCND